MNAAKMDFTGLLSTFPLILELLVLLLSSFSTDSKAASAATSRIIRLRRTNSSKKLKLLRQLLNEVTVDEAMGLIRLKKDSEPRDQLPTRLEDVIRVAGGRGPSADSAAEEYADAEEPSSILGSGMELPEEPSRSKPSIIITGSSNEPATKEQHYVYQSQGQLLFCDLRVRCWMYYIVDGTTFTNIQ